MSEAGERGLADILSSEFEPAPDALASGLTCCDMTSSTDGEPVPGWQSTVTVKRTGMSWRLLPFW